MTDIHPTAVVEPGAELDSDVHIGPLCYVGPHARLGKATRLVSHVAIHGRTTLGSGNRVWSGAVLGAEPQDLKYHGEPAELVIGNDNDIRECVTAHIGTENGGNFTRIGNNNLIMAYVHVGHDCIVGSNCIIANSVQLAGHIQIRDFANIGGATAIHHYVTIGQYSFVGGMTRIVHDVPPFMIVEGNPSRVRGVNQIGLSRHRFDAKHIDRLKDAYRRLFRSGGETGGNMASNLDALARDYPDDPYVGQLVQSLRDTTCGLHGRHLEATRSDNRYHNPVR